MGTNSAAPPEETGPKSFLGVGNCARPPASGQINDVRARVGAWYSNATQCLIAPALQPHALPPARTHQRELLDLAKTHHDERARKAARMTRVQNQDAVLLALVYHGSLH